MTNRIARRRTHQLIAAVAQIAEQVLNATWYLSGIVISFLAADVLQMPVANAISIRQAILTELLIFAPVFLIARYFRWLYFLCSLFVGCVTGVFLVILLRESAVIWAFGIFLSRLYLIISLKNSLDASWPHHINFVIWIAICSVLKYIAF